MSNGRTAKRTGDDALHTAPRTGPDTAHEQAIVCIGTLCEGARFKVHHTDIEGSVVRLGSGCAVVKLRGGEKLVEISGRDGEDVSFVAQVSKTTTIALSTLVTVQSAE